MEVCRRSSWLLLLLGVSLLAATLHGVQGEADPGPSESECRPYIEKALKELEHNEAGATETPETEDSKEDVPTIEITTDDSEHQGDDDEDDDNREGENPEQTAEEPQDSTAEDTQEETDAEGTEADDSEPSAEQDEIVKETQEQVESQEADAAEESEESSENTPEPAQDSGEEDQKESTEDAPVEEDQKESTEDAPVEEEQKESTEDAPESAKESVEEDAKESVEEDATQTDEDNTAEDEAATTENEPVQQPESEEAQQSETEEESAEAVAEVNESEEAKQESEAASDEDDKKVDTKSAEESNEAAADDDKSGIAEEVEAPARSDDESQEQRQEEDSDEAEAAGSTDEADAEQDGPASESAGEESQEDQAASDEDGATTEEDVKSAEGEDNSVPEEDLSLDDEVPKELRPRDHVEHLLKLDEQASETEKIVNRVSEITLRELKKLYENAIKPLEVLYKYRDLSNRHFGDAEIFSKPLILFMGPWSGGKSSIINYLLDNEYNETSLKTGAEPSPAYFNLLIHGPEYEVIDGTELAADFTFSGLQKFGQGLEERLRGVKLPSRLLEKVNIVEIPGILEVRKQVSRVFPFNDACQWFIDRADIIFLVYDPSKLDVGPETEAILDQLKGREHQTRIILNKADQVKPEELMRVQGALIWNISPLMSSPQPPIMYTTSLWSRPYEIWAPTRLLQAQERAFLRDLRSAVDKRIENKIASARRFAVRVRNHAKMVDCYLTTYYNHKSVFGNRKQVADEIIDHPQDYHIYEGLSTLTNISRYDLPDPDVYRDFFKLNPLYEFQQLSATCTYFRGCPINRLDVAIAYDLPELVGKHKRLVESALAEANQTPVPGS